MCTLLLLRWKSKWRKKGWMYEWTYIDERTWYALKHIQKQKYIVKHEYNIIYVYFIWRYVRPIYYVLHGYYLLVTISSTVIYVLQQNVTLRFSFLFIRKHDIIVNTTHPITAWTAEHGEYIDTVVCLRYAHVRDLWKTVYERQRIRNKITPHY